MLHVWSANLKSAAKKYLGVASTELIQRVATRRSRLLLLRRGRMQAHRNNQIKIRVYDKVAKSSS